MELEYRRPLPPELLSEMHKCLPLTDAIYVLVNVSKTFVINNSARMRRNIQRIKTSLNEYIHELLDDQGYFDFNEEDEEEENGREKLEIYDEIVWKPEMDALFRYGAWLTSTRQFLMDNDDLCGMPKNFVEDLLLHLVNSRSTSQMMLQKVKMFFGNATLPIPTFLKQLIEIDAEDEENQIGSRCLFESVELDAENGQMLRIFEGELSQNDEEYELKLCVMNKMDKENLFQILINLDLSKKFIRELAFSQWKMQSLEDHAKLTKYGEKSVEKNDEGKLDLFLRRGAGFSPFRHFKLNPFRHFKLKQNYCINYGEEYADFLISYISNTKHPEDFLDSIDINLEYDISYSSINQIWKICQKGIPKGGKCMNFDNKKLHILSGKTEKPKKNLVNGSFSLFGTAIFEDKLQFTLANIPSNGEYLFNVDVKFGNWRNQCIRMKIQKRKNNKIVELKCRCHHHGIELEKKTKTNDDDGKEDKDEPAYSGKIMNHK